MKGLLHSKRFKRNLRKWICMYVGVLLLFTSVVTYSRYVSSLTVNEKARVTKFNVKINEIQVPMYRAYYPNEKIIYKFEVKPDFEVKTLLTLILKPEKDFIIKSIKENNEEIYTNELGQLNAIPFSVNNITTTSVNEYNYVILSRMILNDNTSNKYEVELSYTYNNEEYYKLNLEELQNKPVIKVDYSAKQQFN